MIKQKISVYPKTKKKYLEYIKSQEINGELFKNKIEQFNNFYVPISQIISRNYLKKKNARVIGLAGGQGSGKSTVSNILKIILKTQFNLETVAISIDDFYKTLKNRKEMSKKISKLFLTRGVPGTHDTKTLYNCLKRLKNKKFSKMLIPKFDKSNDDRCKKNKWTKILKKPDIIIFEGWCVGAKPQKKKDLLHAINALERTFDKNLKWRKKVNQELKSKYKKIYNLIDDLIFLKVPSFNYVYKWRMLQEKKLKLSSNGNKIMDKEELKKFVMYYERITKHMFRTLTNKVKFTIFVDENHKFKSIKLN